MTNDCFETLINRDPQFWSWKITTFCATKKHTLSGYGIYTESFFSFYPKTSYEKNVGPSGEGKSDEKFWCTWKKKIWNWKSSWCQSTFFRENLDVEWKTNWKLSKFSKQTFFSFSTHLNWLILFLVILNTQNTPNSHTHNTSGWWEELETNVDVSGKLSE